LPRRRGFESICVELMRSKFEDHGSSFRSFYRQLERQAGSGPSYPLSRWMRTSFSHALANNRLDFTKCHVHSRQLLTRLHVCTTNQGLEHLRVSHPEVYKFKLCLNAAAAILFENLEIKTRPTAKYQIPRTGGRILVSGLPFSEASHRF
jgi:hypothetical protein